MKRILSIIAVCMACLGFALAGDSTLQGKIAIKKDSKMKTFIVFFPTRQETQSV